MIVSNSNKTRCHHVIPSQNDVTEIAEERMVLMRGKSSPSTLFTTVKLSSDQVIDPNLSQLYPSPDLTDVNVGLFRDLFNMSFLSCSSSNVYFFFLLKMNGTHSKEYPYLCHLEPCTSSSREHEKNVSMISTSSFEKAPSPLREFQGR